MTAEKSCKAKCDRPGHLCAGCDRHLDDSFRCYGCGIRICQDCDCMDGSWIGHPHAAVVHITGEVRIR
jgi:hypothetical protein